MRQCLLLGSLFLLFAVSSRAQQIWVNCFVDSLRTQQDCRDIEQLVMSISGVVSVRAEANEGNVLIFFQTESNYSEEVLRDTISNAGYSCWCIRKGIVGLDRINRVSRARCRGEQK